MRKYWDVVFFTNSIPAAGAKVFVTDSTSGNLVTLYSDNGVTQITNPVTCDQTGFYSFYVADGTYNLQYMIGPVTLRTLTNVQIYDQSNIPEISGAVTITNEIADGTATDAATLTGAETIPMSRGVGLLQTSLTKIGQWVLQTYQGFTQGATGSVNRTVKSKLSDVVSVADFGAVGDGVTDDTIAITNAITYAATNDVPLYWPAGKIYGVTNVNVSVGGGVFDWTGFARIKQLATGNPALPVLLIGGVVVGNTTATATSLSQSQTLTLASVAGIQPGYLLRAMTDRLAYGAHQFDPNNAFGQLCKVQSIAGNTVTLTDNLVFDMPVGTITSGTAQAGTSGTITLSASDSSTYYQLKNYLLTITAGTGAGQSKYIDLYNPSTKVVDIGTSYTGIPQAPWATIPDNTSQYSVAATVSVRIIQPAYIKDLANLELQGYRVPSVSTNGLQFQFCDAPNIYGVKIWDCSVQALIDYQNYHPKMISCDISGANVNNAGNTTFGFGQVSYGSYSPIIAYCTFSNCSQACDANNATMFLTRIGNVINGGGMSWDGVTPMWPATTTMQTCGLATHTSVFGCVDQGNTITDVFFNKQRGMWQTFIGNTLRGRMQYCVQPSYATSVTYLDNVYDDGMTNQPSTGTNGIISGDDGLPIVSSFVNRPLAFMNLRFNTMVINASIVAKGNVVKSLNSTFVWVTDCGVAPGGDSPNNIALTTTDNDIDIVSSGSGLLGIVESDGSGAPNFAQFTSYHNVVRVGGTSYLGSVQADNINLYPFLSNITVSNPLTFQMGINKWLCILPANTVTPLTFPVGNNTFRLTVFEKDSAASNVFDGIVTRGNTTPIASFANTNVNFSTGTPSGSAGTAGNVYVFIRTDALYISNKNSTQCNFVVMLSGAYD
ncbi:glycosyl hydrolase family 28-related protein [Burkholderia territorii]|uniref:glycosyl hydrolase family 28-related protein n=1 Tax=Burkholderia territorii TaxID=1503055 RepID=UPI000AFE73BE|nr:glycosyl hydrolase family 28-related protein [Burkholderia territorii]